MSTQAAVNDRPFAQNQHHQHQHQQSHQHQQHQLQQHHQQQQQQHLHHHVQHRYAPTSNNYQHHHQHPAHNQNPQQSHTNQLNAFYNNSGQQQQQQHHQHHTRHAAHSVGPAPPPTVHPHQAPATQQSNNSPNQAQSSQSSPAAGAPAYMMNCYQTNANGWAGVPLISTASRRPRKHNPLGAATMSVNGNLPPTSVFNQSHGNNVPPLRTHNHQQHHHQHQQQPHHNSHALLAAMTPMVGNVAVQSVAADRNAAGIDFDENAMSRLAAHAHGAPLILTGRHRHKSSASASSAQGGKAHANQTTSHIHYAQRNSLAGSVTFFGSNKSYHQHQQHSNTGEDQNVTFGGMPPSGFVSQSLDSGSVHSDEGIGSGSANGNGSANGMPVDMCLPRIIKPRKRRKKDRKPSASLSGGEAGGDQPMLENNCDQQRQMLSGIGHNNNGMSHKLGHAAGFGQQTVVNSTGNAMLMPSYRNFVGEQQLHYPHSSTFNNITTASAFAPGPYAGSVDTHFIHPQPTMQQFVPATMEPLANAIPMPTVAQFSEQNELTQDEDLSASATSSCSCRLCDPAGRIWAFPLRRSCSDQSDAVEATRRKNVGVIGGNRRHTTPRTEWRSSPLLLPAGAGSGDSGLHGCGFGSSSSSSLSRKGSFSDSGDSGCDILSALSFCDDLLLDSPPATGGGVDGAELEQFQFPDVVFSESINEISRKMLDVLDLTRTHSTGGSSEEGSASSSADDVNVSGVKLGGSLFGDEFLLANASGLLDGTAFDGNVSTDWRHSFDLGAFLQSGPVAGSGVGGGRRGVEADHQQERGDDVINCFDMVWSAPMMSVRE